MGLASGAGAQVAEPGYVPERVYDTRRQVFTDFEAMVAELARVHVIFVGEQHGDPNTHRLQLALVEGLRRRRVPMTVSLEMFERDVQPALDRYLAGGVSEEAFLRDARPWPRYATDYRAVVERARAERWPVVAANVPRRLAAAVASSGIEALTRLSAAERALAAQEIQCPEDAYFDRFEKTMAGHTSGASEGSAAAKSGPEQARAETERTQRYYWSQCVKDETMAESIAAAVEARRREGGPVVHVTGAFHSDFRQGTVERTRRRLPGHTLVVITIMPVADLDPLHPGTEDLERADFLVYTAR